MKTIKITFIYYTLFLVTGFVFAQDTHQDSSLKTHHGIEIAPTMFPLSLQEQMDAVLSEYDIISKKLEQQSNPEERETLQAKLEVLQTQISVLSQKEEPKEDVTANDYDNHEEQKQEIPEKQEQETKQETEEDSEHDANSYGCDLTIPDKMIQDNLLLHLAMVEKGFNWIATTLCNRHLLSDAQNLELDACMYGIKALLENCKQNITKTGLCKNYESYRKKIEILQYFVTLQKNAAVRYDIFMLGHNDTCLALVSEPLTLAQYQKSLCAIFVQLSELFNELLAHADQISLNDIQRYVQDEDIVTKLVREQLPAELQIWAIKRKLDFFTEQARKGALAYAYVGIDLEQIYPELFTSSGFLDIVTKFNSNNYGSYKLLSIELLPDLESLLSLFAQRITELKYNPDTKNNKKVCTLLELMMARLLKIKRIVMQASTWNFDMTNDQESADLMICYNVLTQNQEYHVLFANRPLSDVRDLLKTVIERYCENKAQSDSFLYDLYILKYRLQELKDDLKSKQEYVPKSWTKWLWENASHSYYHPIRTYLDRMLDLVYKLITLTTPTDTQAKKAPSVIEQILSGQWLSPDTVKNNIKTINTDKNGKVVLELVDDLQKRQFSDFKSAAFHALSRVSPLLMVGLMKYLLPYASQELGTKIMNFVTDHEKARDNTDKTGNMGNNNKVTDFIMNNPDVYEQFNRKHPDVLESLGNQVVQKMRA